MRSFQRIQVNMDVTYTAGNSSTKKRSRIVHYFSVNLAIEDEIQICNYWSLIS